MSSEEPSIQTGVQGFDRLMEGGLPRSTLLEVFGLKAVGKSLFGLQSSFSSASEGLNALVFDTELSYFHNLLPFWRKPLTERFKAEIQVQRATVHRTSLEGKRKKASIAVLKESIRSAARQAQIEPSEEQLSQAVAVLLPDLKIEAEKADNAVYIVEEPSLTSLLAIHGVDTDMVVSEGGRVEMRLRGMSRPEDSPLGSFVEEKRISMLVYDSISAPAKSTFTGTQDLPARASSFAFLLGQAQRLASRYNLAIVAINHISVHPHNPSWTHPYGGLIMGYDFKYVFHMEREPSPSKLAEYPIVNIEDCKEHNRLLWVYRHPRIDEYQAAVLVNLDSSGLH